MANPKFSAIPSPCYVLEEKKLRKNLKLLKKVREKAGVEIILAFKAFANWQIFPIIREYLDGATASSLWEARLCQQEMGNLAHTYSPAYLPEEFNKIMKLSSHITFNSLSQYEIFYPKIKAFKKRKIKCGLRVNPEYSKVKIDLYNPCAPGSRLGEVHSNLEKKLPKGITGLHFHSLCESDSYELEKTLDKIEKHFGHFLPKLDWINMGGGHLITGKNYDVSHLIKILKAFKKKYDLKIILEPGSAIGLDSGFLRTRVLDITNNHGIKTAIIDASFTAHMPDTLEMPYRPPVKGAVKKSDHLYRLGGVSCLSGDYLEDYYFKKPLKIGDPIILKDMMHYTMVKTTMFNGVKHPSFGVIDLNGNFRVLRKFNYQDFKSRLG